MDHVTVKTSQNVSIDYPLANVGQRILAFTVDLVAYALLYLLLIILTKDSFPNRVSGMIVAYATFFGFLAYFFFTELFFRGQTAGKRLLSIRVTRTDGNDPTPADCLTRTIFLLPDVLLSAGIPAVLLVTTGRYHQRLGDLVAGTVVLRDKTTAARPLHELVNLQRQDDYEPSFPGVQRFTDDDMMIVKQTLYRHRAYANSAHREALRKLAARVAEQLELEGEVTKLSPADFLEIVLRDYIILTR